MGEWVNVGVVVQDYRRGGTVSIWFPAPTDLVRHHVYEYVYMYVLVQIDLGHLVVSFRYVYPLSVWGLYSPIVGV
jgi:hypothetical protein